MMFSPCSKHLKHIAFKVSSMHLCFRIRSVSTYVQGQSPSKNVREYFYFIDHQGQLFLHDARIKNFTSCFKENRFLTFFFKRMKANETERYTDFPYISPCGKEMNYIQCDDRPVVFTSIVEDNGNSGELLTINNTQNITTFFDPTKICMFPKTGRIYHPADEKYGGVGLIKSSLAIQLSQYFEFANNEDNPPTHFNWNGKLHSLDYSWIMNC